MTLSKIPPHPGTVLLEKFLRPNRITQKQLADHLGWTYARLNEIIKQRRGITADSALSLAECFNTTAEFWMHLQVQCDLWQSAQMHVRVPAWPNDLCVSVTTKEPASLGIDQD